MNKRVLAIFLAGLLVGIALGRFDHDADERRRVLATGALYWVVDAQPNRLALWRQFKATFAEAQAKQ